MEQFGQLLLNRRLSDQRHNHWAALGKMTTSLLRCQTSLPLHSHSYKTTKQYDFSGWSNSKQLPRVVSSKNNNIIEHQQQPSQQRQQNYNTY